MVEMLIYGNRQQEVRVIQTYSSEYAALFTEEQWQYHCYCELNQLKPFVKEKHSLDMICMDITEEGGLEQIQELRKNNQNAYVTLVASLRMSPASYMRPGIMAGSLLLKPLTKEQMETVLKEAFSAFAKRFQDPDREKAFYVDTRSGKYIVDYDRICYFEAREKKIFLITESREISFYSTMEELQKQLPDSFMRCHRSFLVNSEKITQIRLGQQTLELDNGDEIPVSRSYRTIFKEFK